MKVIFGGTTRHLGALGLVDQGSCIDLSPEAYATVIANPLFALHPSELRMDLFSQPCDDITEDYEVDPETDNGKIICVHAHSGNLDITLPPSADLPLGFHFYIWDRHEASAHPITITPDGTDCIRTLTKQVESVTVGAAGTGFTSIPEVEFSSDEGYGAEATAKLKAVGVAIQAAGTGYSVGNTLTIVGGTSTQAITLTVTSVNSGAITGVSIAQAGSYSALPSNAAAVTGGAGSGATFNITWGVASVSMVEKGYGYMSATAVIAGGGGSGATLTPVLSIAPRVLNRDGDRMGYVWCGAWWDEM